MKLFLTGGTGFFGRAILRKFCSEASLGEVIPEVTVLSRSPKTFFTQYPEFSGLPWLKLVSGDICKADTLPVGESFTDILHAATDSTTGLLLPPLERYGQIVTGTKNILDFSVMVGAKRFLLTSSGAVYGPQPSGLSLIPEDYFGMPDPLNPNNAYGVGKRAAEHLCALYAQSFGLEIMIARCFAFIGRDLPMNVHFAIGNFIRDALNGDAILVKGDGSPIRSYLDQRDLANWLISILVSGKNNQAYNVGSDQALTISDLAHLIRDLLAPGANIRFGSDASLGANRNLYVPCINKARQDLGLKINHSLSDAIEEVAVAILNG